MMTALVNAALLLAVPAGHALFWVGLVNRAHGIDLGHDALHRLHKVHNLALLGGTLAWFAGVGFFGPRLLFGGTWRELSWPLLAVALFFCAVFAGWSVYYLSRVLAPRPRQVLARVPRRLNLEEELKVSLRGPGPYRALQQLPGNEFLHLEVVELEVCLPRLPPAWDGLSIVHFSDVHFIGTVGRPYFEHLFQIIDSLRGNLVVFTGDLLDDPRLLDWLDTTFGTARADLGCYFILGNHDREWGDVDATRAALARLGWKDATAATTMIPHREGLLAIAGTERPWMGEDPDWSGVPPEAFRLLLSHSPDNLAKARRDQVDLMLAGHTHGGQVRLPLIGPVYAPSRHGVQYASGTFWKSPTLLHVSRGIAGRHPWRWNCPPELTRLVLRSKRKH